MFFLEFLIPDSHYINHFKYSYPVFLTLKVHYLHFYIYFCNVFHDSFVMRWGVYSLFSEQISPRRANCGRCFNGGSCPWRMGGNSERCYIMKAFTTHCLRLSEI